MTEEKRTVEISGSDVEAAVAQGLAQLGVAREQVEVQILDEGSKGILGMGKRDALVKLVTNMMAVEETAQMVVEEEVKAEEKVVVDEDPHVALHSAVDEILAQNMPAFTSATTQATPNVDADDTPASSEVVETASEQEMVDEEISAATKIVEELLEKLQIDATIESRLSELDEKTNSRVPILNVEGQDLSVLIGPRGDTLSALHYLTRLMTAHAIKRRANVILDVAGYRERRKQALAKLAERMASKAVKRNRAVTLEPMPAHERRAVHIALREHPQVFTESAGTGNGRRVRILLKR